MGAEIADPPAVAGDCQMHAIGLGELRREIPGVVGKLSAEVKIIAPTLGTKLLNGRVDDRQTVRGQTRQTVGGLLLRGGQDRLHIEHRVRQGGAQIVQHFAVVRQKAVVVAGLDQGVRANQDVQLRGLGRGQNVQRHLLAAVRAGDGGAVDDGVRADALIAADQRTTHINVVFVHAEARGQRIAEEGGIRKPACVHAAKFRQRGGGGGQRRVGVARVGVSVSEPFLYLFSSKNCIFHKFLYRTF